MDKEIKEKGFNMLSGAKTEFAFDSIEKLAIERQFDYSKIKVGLKTLDDAIIDVSDLKKINSSLASKEKVLRAMYDEDYSKLREISNFFYNTSGIYKRLCKYLAYMYKYDWFITPYIRDKKMKANKIEESFNNVLSFADNLQIKGMMKEISLKVIRNGCYYGYVIKTKDNVSIQELPPDYCRSRFFSNGVPAVEFNMKFFDDVFKDNAQRAKVLNTFPSEFEKGYMLFKQNKLQPDFRGDTRGWYLLNPDNTVKFSVDGEDAPLLISVIPSIIDLDESKALDRKKVMQKLLKIVIQKLPLDKNGELIFDVDEARELHNNAVAMLGKAVGVDVLTTFAETDVADMSDSNTSAATDDLSRAERAVYNEAGISQQQFNSSSNLALEKSIANDEAQMDVLVLQQQQFLNRLLSSFNIKGKIQYSLFILPTTVYNYKELSDKYKAQTQLGYSKMLPQIALGQSQSSILATAYFENEVLGLNDIFVPPMSSNTMSANANKTVNSNKTTSNAADPLKAGRKELPDDKKSDKTLANRASM